MSNHWRAHAAALVAMVFLCGLAAGCGGGGGISSVSVPLVAGTVYSAVTQAPVRGAAVTVGRYTMVTGDDGGFELLNPVLNPVFTITISSPGHTTVGGDFEAIRGKEYRFSVVLPGSGSTGPGRGTVTGRVIMRNSYIPGLEAGAASAGAAFAAAGNAPFASRARASYPSASMMADDDDPRRTVVRAVSGVTMSALEQCVTGLGGAVVYRGGKGAGYYSAPPLFVAAQPPDGVSSADFAVQIAAAYPGAVEYAHPDARIYAQSQPVEAAAWPGRTLSDPLYSSQWYLRATDLAFTLRGDDGSYGRGYPVVVLDTGIVDGHPDVPAHSLYPWNEYNYIDHTTNIVYTPPAGMISHGTAMVSLLEACADNGLGIAGAMANDNPTQRPGTSVYKVLGDDGVGWDSVLAEALFDQAGRAAVIAMPLGRPGQATPILAEALDKAVALTGKWLVAAAGNSGGAVMCPANYPGVIAVAATDQAGNIAPYSCRGPEIMCAAPGGAPIGIGPSGPAGRIVAASWSQSEGYFYPWVSGTSVACMLVSAMLAEECPHPSYYLEHLIDSCIDMGAPGRDDNYGHGLISASQYVMHVSEADMVVAIVDTSQPNWQLVSSVTSPNAGGYFAVTGCARGEFAAFFWCDTDRDADISSRDYIALVPVTVPAPGTGSHASITADAYMVGFLEELASATAAARTGPAATISPAAVIERARAILPQLSMATADPITVEITPRGGAR